MNETPFEELVQHFEEPNRDEWQKPDVVLSKFGNLEGKKIGDIGAGSGYFAFKMAEKGANVIAIDVDQRFVDYMNIKKEKTKVKNIHTRMAEYHDPHLTDNEFDGLITVNTYHHFNDRIDYLKRCYKGLKKGGQLMIVDFRKMETPFGPPVDHKIAHSQVVSELEKVGFTIDEVDIKSLPYQYVVLGKK